MSHDEEYIGPHDACAAEIHRLQERIAAYGLQIASLCDALSTKAAEAERLRAALAPFLGDATMEELLWGGMDDEALGSVSVKLKHFRNARSALGASHDR